MDIKKIYFRNFTSPVNATCRNCNESTQYTNKIRLRTKSSDPNVLGDQVKYGLEYQCQACGTLKMFYLDKGPDFEESLGEVCICGGEFKRDEHLFCNKCFYNK